MKIKGFILSLVIAAMLMVPSASFGAAAVVTQQMYKLYENVYKLRFSIVADSTNGSVTSTTTEHNIDGFVFMVITNPGATAPDEYGIVLNNSDGIDVMGGKLAARHATTSQVAVPSFDDVRGSIYVDGPLTMVISDQATNSAIIVMDIYFYR